MKTNCEGDCPSVCLFVCLSASACLYLAPSRCVYLTTYSLLVAAACMSSLCQSVCLSVFSVSLSASLSVLLSVCLSVCLSICLSASQVDSKSLPVSTRIANASPYEEEDQASVQSGKVNNSKYEY